MSIPNADRAIVDPAKIRDTLLSAAHPIGRFKAAFLLSLGYSADRWEVLDCGLHAPGWNRADHLGQAGADSGGDIL